ncbi:MAG: universal stress protein [Longimonas sp.]|uniref:universal stress protein n=1 Tax=Longimonas sp. TaxID=2039626 RepID=UPI0033491C2C
MPESDFTPQTILIDVSLPEAAALSDELIALLGSLHVVLVGWFEVPEQTSAAQANDQFGREMNERLDVLAGVLREAGAAVETRLVFTGNPLDTMERISAEVDSDAVLIPYAHDRVEKVLVPLRDARHADRIATFVNHLVQTDTASFTLLHVREEGETDADVLTPVAESLTTIGMDSSVIEKRLVDANDPAAAILDAAHDHDLVVMGESEPAARDILFGTVPERIARNANIPVIMVRTHSKA